jgi:plasmid stabilization system protein ParE
MVQRLCNRMRELAEFPWLGILRDDLGHGLRLLLVVPCLVVDMHREKQISAIRMLHGARKLPDVLTSGARTA